MVVRTVAPPRENITIVAGVGRTTMHHPSRNGKHRTVECLSRACRRVCSSNLKLNGISSPRAVCVARVTKSLVPYEISSESEGAGQYQLSGRGKA